MNSPLNLAVLRILNGDFRCSNVAVQMGWATQETVNKELELIRNYREWLKTQTDRKLIEAYDYWLSHFENQIKDAQRAINDGEHEKWQKQYVESREEFRGISELAATLPRMKV